MPCAWEPEPSLQRADFLYVEWVVAVVPILGVLVGIVQVNEQTHFFFHEFVITHLALDERAVDCPIHVISDLQKRFANGGLRADVELSLDGRLIFRLRPLYPCADRGDERGLTITRTALGKVDEIPGVAMHHIFKQQTDQVVIESVLLTVKGALKNALDPPQPTPKISR